MSPSSVYWQQLNQQLGHVSYKFHLISPDCHLSSISLQYRFMAWNNSFYSYEPYSAIKQPFKIHSFLSFRVFCVCCRSTSTVSAVQRVVKVAGFMLPLSWPLIALQDGYTPQKHHSFHCIHSIIPFVPCLLQEYIHRVGRTARGEGGRGHALLILRPEEIGFLSYLKQAKVPLNEFEFAWAKIANIQAQVREINTRLVSYELIWWKDRKDMNHIITCAKRTL